ncbi:hypothetical protein [Kitasatospora purpeofusca]|uniref:hypothetical protein n=1 Tax=Kitasatospora purpeofusca TaxID=67352 RepID=UPI003870EAC6|nr:hypothetical protein OIP63_16115 [Kitasatospora purpeofusca]
MNGTDGVLVRGLWLLIIMLTGTLGGLLAGLSMYIAGATLAGALAAGGAAFVGLVGLGMAVHKFIRE